LSTGIGGIGPNRSRQVAYRQRAGEQPLHQVNVIGEDREQIVSIDAKRPAIAQDGRPPS
jgi:hypothetical protein